MIDFSDVPIVVDGKDNHFLTTYTAKARILLESQVDIHKHAGVPEYLIRERLLKELWHRTYGDLVRPFWEFSSVSLRHCDSLLFPEVQEKQKVLAELLKMPSFKQ